MEFPDNFKDAVKLVCEEWNKAERAIKSAEQVNKKVINPAVYELRYAGRRFVEAVEQSEVDAQKALSLCQDAHFDCCRARHDAIDAITSYVTEVMDLAVKKLGAGIVLDKFPEIKDMNVLLSDMRAKIAKSREERDKRDIIYSAIEADKLSELVPLYERFKQSEPLLMAAATSERRALNLYKIFGWGGLIFAFATLIVTFVF